MEPSRQGYLLLCLQIVDICLAVSLTRPFTLDWHVLCGLDSNTLGCLSMRPLYR